MNKAELRAQMRSVRRSLSQTEQEQAARAVYAHLLEYEPYKRARVVMAYMAVRGELSLAPVIEDILSSSRTLLLPRCEAPGIMTARRIRSFGDLVPGTFGLPEPKAECEAIDPTEIDLIFVPGVAFDPAGRRLGQGGGYYDRFLVKTDARRTGVCHEFALLDAVPFEAHDVLMDDVITPGGICPSGKRGDRRT